MREIKNKRINSKPKKVVNEEVIDNNEKLEKERLEKEKLEKERIEKERLEREIKEKQRIEENKKEMKFVVTINVILFIILFSWLGICMTDFIKTRNNEKPMFCIKEKTKNYSDGSVYSCTGLGYKVFYYNRKSISGKEYCPFWSKDKSAYLK